MLILWILLFSIVGSIGAIIIACAFLLFKEKIQEVLIPCLIAYASGTLLAGGLLGLLPHALKQAPVQPILITLLSGIIFFFILEKLVIWRHCHDPECEVHKATGPMILIGDAFHNLVDGVVIAAAFIASVPLGIASGLSIIAHEIPQEVGDFGILLHSGYSKKKAFVLNILSGLTTLPGALIAYLALDMIHNYVPYVMAISASSFLYISLADISPELQNQVGVRYTIRQLLLILSGVGTIAIVLQFHP
jgi:zinc and cadmium transporter